VLTVLYLRDIHHRSDQKLVFAWLVALTAPITAFASAAAPKQWARATTASVVTPSSRDRGGQHPGLVFYFGRGLEY
jgi:hypothetical protein